MKTGPPINDYLDIWEFIRYPSSVRNDSCGLDRFPSICKQSENSL